jgi:RNA polymerase sigma factor (sigma-70 family)
LWRWAPATRTRSARMVEDHRAELHAHCYRMLGSLHDAEDALQDTLLRVWRGLPTFRGRSSLRTWLYKIATNACLDVIARRPKRVLPIDLGPPSAVPTGDLGPPVVESVWVEPYPDEALGLSAGYAVPEARYEQREAVELAFIAALQHLSARQRAVLILREVLGFSAQEVGDSLDVSVASVNSTPCSVPAGRLLIGFPSEVSRRRCARSVTNESENLSTPMSMPGRGVTSRRSERFWNRRRRQPTRSRVTSCQRSVRLPASSRAIGSSLPTARASRSSCSRPRTRHGDQPRRPAAGRRPASPSTMSSFGEWLPAPDGRKVVNKSGST